MISFPAGALFYDILWEQTSMFVFLCFGATGIWSEHLSTWSTVTNIADTLKTVLFCSYFCCHETRRSPKYSGKMK